MSIKQLCPARKTSVWPYHKNGILHNAVVCMAEEACKDPTHISTKTQAEHLVRQEKILQVCREILTSTDNSGGRLAPASVRAKLPTLEFTDDEFKNAVCAMRGV